MSHIALFLVLAAFIGGGVLLFNMQSNTERAQDRLNDYQYQQLARDAAITGLNLTVRKLAADVDDWDNGAAYGFASTTYGSGSFTVVVTPVGTSGDTVDVVATGTNGSTNLVVDARYAREYADGGVPPAFRNVITTDNYIQLQGNVHVRSVSPSLNASIHTNGNLTTVGNSFLVDGYGTYTGTISSNQIDNFVPNIDWNGADPNAFWADSVHIPLINPAELQALAATSGAVLNGPLPIAGVGNNSSAVALDFTNPASLPWAGAGPNCTGGSCGTPENPYILFVNGPITFNSRVRMNGHVIIYSTSHVVVNPAGNGGGVFGPLTAGSYETTALLAAHGNITLQGNACLGLGPGMHNGCTSGSSQFTHGVTLYARAALSPSSGITFQGVPSLVGGIISARTSFEGAGTPHVVYAAPTETIIDPGFEYIVPIGPVLIAYSEW